MSTAIAPVSAKQRIGLMDALRGFAILGIFIANLGSGFTFYDPSGPHTGPWFSSFDHTMTFLHHLFIEGKFYSIFSFLFGWGIALQIQRSASAGGKPVSFIRRRLFFMFLLGLAHIILLWPGDIVAFYGLVGFLLLFFRNAGNRTLLVSAIILILSPILLYFLKMRWPMIFNAPAGLLFQTGQNVGTRLTGITSDEAFFNYLRHTDYWGNIRLNMAGFFFRFGDLFFQSRISKVLGMFLVGYAIGRNNNWKAFLGNTKLLWMIALGGLLIGLPANYTLAHYKDLYPQAYYNLKREGMYQTIAYALGVAPLALAYIALLFLVAKSVWGQKLLSVLQPPGKMAFSNYIFQSLVGILVFLPFGGNLMGRVGPVYFTIFAVLVFAVQILISMLWLRYFQFGPIEWLWRSATYGRWQPFIKRKAVVEDGP